MIESLKELVLMLKDVPEFALWILGGFLFYKLFFMGSIVGAIVKISSMLISYLRETRLEALKPKEVVKKVELNGHFISHDGTLDEFFDFLEIVKINQKYETNYIHKGAVRFMVEAWHEKRQRENLPEAIRFKKSNFTTAVKS